MKIVVKSALNTYILQGRVLMSPVMRKPVFGVSEQIRHKPGCTATENSKRLEILDLERRGIVPSV